MSELWNNFKKLFQAAENSSASNPLIHEVISRTEEEKAGYERWKTTLVRRRLIDWLHQQYVKYLVNPGDTDRAIDFLDTPSSKGFVIHLFETGYTRQEAEYMMDFLRERVMTFNYKTYISDLRSYSRGEKVETVQRHYLKPRIKVSSGDKFKQVFGNITIELLLINDDLVNLKFRANSYQDHKFESAADFDQLMQQILSD